MPLRPQCSCHGYQCTMCVLIGFVCVFFLSEKYFDMNKKQCKDGLDLYKKFLVRMEKVSEFLKVAEVSI